MELRRFPVNNVSTQVDTGWNVNSRVAYED